MFHSDARIPHTNRCSRVTYLSMPINKITRQQKREVSDILSYFYIFIMRYDYSEYLNFEHAERHGAVSIAMTAKSSTHASPAFEFPVQI